MLRSVLEVIVGYIVMFIKTREALVLVLDGRDCV
jgi:hypothetical protein